MAKKALGKYPYVYPIPTILFGAMVDGKPNFSTLGNCGIMSINPAVLYVSSVKSHHTNKGARDNGCFSVNIPSTGLLERTDYCGLVSGAKSDKSEVFKTFFGGNPAVPMIEECPVTIACTVAETVEIHNMEVFIGNVVESYADEDCLVDGKPDIRRVDPIIYSVKGRYWSLGREIGMPFSDGKKFGV